jgi:hypothetical protein
MTVSIADQLAAVEREIRLRQRVYPRWVETSRMTQVKADQELAAMRAVAETLRALVPASAQGGLFGAGPGT